MAMSLGTFGNTSLSLHHYSRGKAKVPQNKYYYRPQSGFRAKPGTSYVSPNPVVNTIKAQFDDRKEDIVVVGAGIAGLATAVALHRCIKSFECIIMYIDCGSCG